MYLVNQVYSDLIAHRVCIYPGNRSWSVSSYYNPCSTCSSRVGSVYLLSPARFIYPHCFNVARFPLAGMWRRTASCYKWFPPVKIDLKINKCWPWIFCLWCFHVCVCVLLFWIKVLAHISKALSDEGYNPEWLMNSHSVCIMLFMFMVLPLLLGGLCVCIFTINCTVML